MSDGYIRSISTGVKTYNPWLELRNAIIARATDDYKLGFLNPTRRDFKNLQENARRFLLSKWCQNLLDMDGINLTGYEIITRIEQYLMEDMKQKQEESTMKVTLIQQTPEPLKTISKIASICYDSNPGNPKTMVRKLYLSGHHSPFEHIYFTFKIEGISRACSHQLVRHRLAAITQRSQRYVEENGFDYVKPYEVRMEDEANDLFETEIGHINDVYCDLIHLHGIKKEDARFLLPNACTTELYFSVNLRELIHIANERLCTRAQWEIRDVVKQMVKLVDPELQWMLVPKCESGFQICNSPCQGRGYTIIHKDE